MSSTSKKDDEVVDTFEGFLEKLHADTIEHTNPLYQPLETVDMTNVGDKVLFAYCFGYCRLKFGVPFFIFVS